MTKPESKPPDAPPPDWGAVFTRLGEIEGHLKTQDTQREDHLRQQDRRMDGIEKKVDCVMEGVAGTTQTIGLAGHVRNLNDWRGELEKEEPLYVQIEKIKAWQYVATRIALGAFAVVGIPIITGVLTLLWLLINNRAEIILH